MWLQLGRRCWRSQPVTQNHSSDNQQDSQHRAPRRLLGTVGRIGLQYRAVCDQRPQANALETVPQLRLHFLQETQADSNEPVQLGKVLFLKAVGETSCKMCHNYCDKNPKPMTSIGTSFHCLHFTSTCTCFSAVKIFPCKVIIFSS